MIDKVVDEVLTKYIVRSDMGARKYGTTLHENNFDNYLKHLQEELMDATLYVEKIRSEEHTSELQSPMYLVCRLLLEKKNYKYRP